MTAVLPTLTSLFTPRVRPSLKATSHRSLKPTLTRAEGRDPLATPNLPRPQGGGGGAPHRGYCPNLRSSHLSVSSPPAAAIAAAPQGPVVTDTNHRTPRTWAARVSGVAGPDGLVAAMLGTGAFSTTSGSAFA